MALEEEFTFSWSHWGDLACSLSILTICKSETTLVHSHINLQAYYAMCKDFEKQGHNETRVRYIYIRTTSFEELKTIPLWKQYINSEKPELIARRNK